MASREELIAAQRDQLAQRVEAGVSGISAAMQQIGVPGDGYPANIALAHQMLAATLSFLDSAPSTEPEQRAKRVDRMPSHSSPPPDDKPIYFTIDRQVFEAEQGVYAADELRSLTEPPIGPDRDLWQQRPGENDRKIEDGVTLSVSGHRFWTTPKYINASAPSTGDTTPREGEKP